jgi:hypothetical protein
MFAFIIYQFHFLSNTYMGIECSCYFFKSLLHKNSVSCLDTLDKTQNSYQYLISFDNWVKENDCNKH